MHSTETHFVCRPSAGRKIKRYNEVKRSWNLQRTAENWSLELLSDGESKKLFSSLPVREEEWVRERKNVSHLLSTLSRLPSKHLRDSFCRVWAMKLLSCPINWNIKEIYGSFLMLYDKFETFFIFFQTSLWTLNRVNFIGRRQKKKHIEGFTCNEILFVPSCSGMLVHGNFEIFIFLFFMAPRQ